MHFLLLCANTCLLRNVSPGVFCAFFQDLSLKEYRLAVPATKTGTVRGMCVVVAFRPSCIHPLYVTVGYRNDVEYLGLPLDLSSAHPLHSLIHSFHLFPILVIL
jgi:hypothetical protein